MFLDILFLKVYYIVMSFSLVLDSNQAINTITAPHNSLDYYFDFYSKPTHPYGTNKYKCYSSFISFGTPSTIAFTNNQSYILISGLGDVNTNFCRLGNPTTSVPNGTLYKIIQMERTPPFGATFEQKWIDKSPLLPTIIEDLNDTGKISVEIRLITTNNLSNNANAFGAVATSYLINLLFEPIE